MPGDIQKISNQLWDAADELRANSKWKEILVEKNLKNDYNHGHGVAY